MFTRTNIVVAIFLFILFFVLLLVFFSPIGILEYNDMKQESLRLNSLVGMQSAKLNLMRQTANDKLDPSKEDLILLFDDVYNPTSRNDEMISYFEPMGYFSIVAISFIPSFIYLLVCIIHKKISKRR